MEISFDRWEYELAFQTGIRRFTENWGSADKPYYGNRARMEPDMIAGPAAVLCELAVAKYLGVYCCAGAWNARDHWKYKNDPDIRPNIQVRRVRTNRGVAVRKTDKGMRIWAVRLIDEEFRKARLLGYIDAEDAFRVAIDQGGYLAVPESRLIQPWTSTSLLGSTSPTMTITDALDTSVH